VTADKPSTRRATILDVAAAAGVSRQTVNRAMNDQSGISAETRERVMRVVAELGYRPSRFARNFVSRDKRLAVGLVVASFRNPYYTDMAGDFLECAQARGWQVVMTSPVNAPETEALAMLSTQVDAVAGHFDGAEDGLIAAAAGLPLVMLERPATRPGVHSVEMDLRLGMQILLTELRERGGRRIGMIDSAYSLRTEGRYVPSPRRAYFEEFAPDCVDRVVVGTESIVGGAQALKKMVAEHPEVDSVIVFNDLMALGVIQAAHAAPGGSRAAAHRRHRRPLARTRGEPAAVDPGDRPPRHGRGRTRADRRRPRQRAPGAFAAAHHGSAPAVARVRLSTPNRRPRSV
jgi:DNA-binding LacI/PurR family transcriptional regulator